MGNSIQSKWLEQAFQAQQVQAGGIIRRSVKSVLRNSSEEELKDVVEQLGFHMVKSGKQFIILCNPGDFKLVI